MYSFYVHTCVTKTVTLNIVSLQIVIEKVDSTRLIKIFSKLIQHNCNSIHIKILNRSLQHIQFIFILKTYTESWACCVFLTKTILIHVCSWCVTEYSLLPGIVYKLLWCSLQSRADEGTQEQFSVKREAEMGFPWIHNVCTKRPELATKE